MNEYLEYLRMPLEVVGVEPVTQATVSVEARDISTGQRKRFRISLKRFRWGVGDFITFNDQGGIEDA